MALAKSCGVVRLRGNSVSESRASVHGPAWFSEEVTAIESFRIRGLTMSRQTDTRDLMNPERRDQRESQTDASIDEIELGIGKDFREVDEQGEPTVLTRPKPHGLLPIPPEVEAVVAREEVRLLREHGITPTPEARQRMLDSLTLQYYFDGIDVAYRRTTRGVEVVAVGLDEVGELVRTTPQERRRPRLWPRLTMSRLERPLLTKTIALTGDIALRAELTLRIKTNAQSWESVIFLVDPGTEMTTLPAPRAKQLAIPIPQKPGDQGQTAGRGMPAQSCRVNGLLKARLERTRLVRGDHDSRTFNTYYTCGERSPAGS